MKAVQIFSGGLDSILAACLIKKQGIDVLAVHFLSPFFGDSEKAGAAAARTGAVFLPIRLGEDYFDMLKNPRYGYGKNANPCIDCHAFMFRMAGQLMEDNGASFLFSGEVLGQRPMSQNKNSLQLVDRLSGYGGLIVRPLSAQLLPETVPEQKGWLDRSQLLAISGRSRKPQMEIAESLGITDYPSPAGGCLLTQENYSRRMRRYLSLQEGARLDDLEILSCGRHLYIDEHSLLVVGRNQSDNRRIQELALPSDYLIKTQERPGPLAMLRSNRTPDRELLTLAASIVASYSDTRDLPLVKVRISQGDWSDCWEVEAMPRQSIPGGL